MTEQFTPTEAEANRPPEAHLITQEELRLVGLHQYIYEGRWGHDEASLWLNDWLDRRLDKSS